MVALLHFELFRIFGPSYSKDKEKECIPYALTSETKVNPLLPAREIARLIMEDLKNAEESLTGYDPVIETGSVWGDDPEGGVNDMRYRSMRLNYCGSLLWGKGGRLGVRGENDSRDTRGT